MGGAGVGLPEAIDIVIDDADHFKSTQIHNFDEWFPRVREGGLYIIEDIFMTPTPWAGWKTARNRVPSSNANCSAIRAEGGGCWFPPKPAEHPFVRGEFEGLMKEELTGQHQRDYFFTITGTHAGGGLDIMMVIRK